MFRWLARNEVDREIFSIDKTVKCHVRLESGKVYYSVYKDNKLVIKPSKLGFLICGEKPLIDNFKLIREQRKKHQEIIEMPWDENQYINNNYIESTFYLSEKKEPYRIMTLRFRVFNDGVAFRYEIQPQPKFSQITIED